MAPYIFYSYILTSKNEQKLFHNFQDWPNRGLICPGWGIRISCSFGHLSISSWPRIPTLGLFIMSTPTRCTLSYGENPTVPAVNEPKQTLAEMLNNQIYFKRNLLNSVINYSYKITLNRNKYFLTNEPSDQKSYT